MKKYLILTLAVVFGLTACEDFLDVNTDPNNPSEGSLELVLPAAQVAMGFSLNRVGNENTMIFSNMIYDLSESQYTQDPSTYNNDWNGFYGNILADIDVILEEAEAIDDAGYLGVAKVMKAYMYNIIVDAWGDVPYSEAGLGIENIAPNPDDDADVYQDVLELLEEAKSDLLRADTAGTMLTGDVFYGNNPLQWAKLANSLQLRMYLNMKDVQTQQARDGIAAVLGDNDAGLIESNSENFVFNYGTSIAPQNTNPLYQQDIFTVNKTFYMSNYFMLKLLEKNDPRTPFYIYRQDDGSSLDFQTTPCSQRTDCPIGYLGDLNAAWAGYIGRDHGDISGLPGDNELRSTFGPYPVGGTFDNGAFTDVVARRNSNGSGNYGAGLMPFLTSSMVDFMRAEAAVSLGTGEDPVALLESGIRKSMALVNSVGLRIENSNEFITPMVDSLIDEYVTARIDEYNNASDDDGRIDVIVEEKYFAEFGNGWEAWTDVRRTGSPMDRPSSIVPAAPYPLRLPYGLQEVNTNPNISVVNQGVPVFWDIE